MTSKDKKKLQEINIAFNSAWSLVTLHSKGWPEVLKQLGISNEEFTSITSGNIEDKPDYPSFKKLKDHVISRAAPSEGGGGITLREVKPSEEPLIDYYTQDSLIESDYKIPQTRREQLRELCAGYLPPPNPKQKCKLYPFQEEWALEAFYKIVIQKDRGRLLRANTGDGKTFALGYLLRLLIDINFAERSQCVSPWPYLYVTKASIVDQTTADLRDEFGIDVPNEVMVIHYDGLRSALGEQFINEEIIVEHGEEFVKYSWKPVIHPILLILDEYQATKNTSSQQSRICVAYTEIDKGPTSNKTIIISASATPFSKVESAKVFCLSTHRMIEYAGQKLELITSRWPLESHRIASPAKPTEYSKEAIKRLLKTYAPYIGGFKNVRRKHHANNREVIIQFRTKEDAQKYMRAFEDYQLALGKIDKSGSKAKGILRLVELLKFRQAAELLRAEEFAERMKGYVEGDNLAAICACNFKASIAKTLITLNTKYGVSRNRISLIWGGDSAFSGSSEGEKYSKDEIRSILTRAMTEEIPDKTLKEILKQLQYEAAGLGDIPKDLDMGIQSRKARWENIQRFQNGESQYCFFTFGAGGAGLSLHHKYPHTRQRRTIVAPTYNEMEMNQALGRAPRLTSLSDTDQDILLYAGTIEIAVLYRVNEKSQCLNTVIEHSETPEGQQRMLEEIMELSGVKDEDEDDDLGHEVFEEVEQEQQKEMSIYEKI